MGYLNQSAPDFSNLQMGPGPGEAPVFVEPDGFFSSIPDALGSGLVTSGTTAMAGIVGIPAIGLDWVNSRLSGEDTSDRQDAIFNMLIDPGVSFAQGLNQKERTFAGSLTFGVGKVLTEFAQGGAGVMAVSEFGGRAFGEVKMGSDANKASMLGANQAAFAYLGAALPGAFGGTLKAKIATGAGINVAAGVAQRGAEKGILYGYDDQRYKDIGIFNAEDMVVDAVLGAAFGPFERSRQGQKEGRAEVRPEARPSGEAIDAAMTMDRARFEDAQVRGADAATVAKIDRGFEETIRATEEGRAPLVDPLPDSITLATSLPEVVPSRDVVVPELDSIEVAVAKLGGLSRVEAEAQGIDPAYFNQMGSGIKRIFTKNGASFDQMAERLDELGYPVRDESGAYSANKVLELMDRALRGEPVRTAVGEERAAAIEWRESQREEMLQYAEQAAKDADIDAAIEKGLRGEGGTKIETEADAAKAFGLEVKEWQDSQVDLSQKIDDEMSPESMEAIIKQAEELGDFADDVDMIEAARYEENVKAMSEIMGCVFTAGAGRV